VAQAEKACFDNDQLQRFRTILTSNSTHSVLSTSLLDSYFQIRNEEMSKTIERQEASQSFQELKRALQEVGITATTCTGLLHCLVSEAQGHYDRDIGVPTLPVNTTTVGEFISEELQESKRRANIQRAGRKDNTDSEATMQAALLLAMKLDSKDPRISVKRLTRTFGVEHLIPTQGWAIKALPQTRSRSKSGIFAVVFLPLDEMLLWKDFSVDRSATSYVATIEFYIQQIHDRLRVS
jgi:hypothetical protein